MLIKRVIGARIELPEKEAEDLVKILKKYGSVIELPYYVVENKRVPYVFDFAIATPTKYYYVRLKDREVKVSSDDTFITLMKVLMKHSRVAKAGAKKASQPSQKPDLVIIDPVGQQYNVYLKSDLS
jgi:hypothetical protein